MPSLVELASVEEIREEYQKTFMLNLFRKVCVRMKNDTAYKTKIRTLFLETHDKEMTAKIIIAKAFRYDLSEEEAKQMSKWLEAHFRKSSKRISIPLSVKIDLYNKQTGKCAVCGEPLGNNWSKIHVDHIIPWMLVGDELDNNYQDLCDTCNECKSASTDYIFKNLIKLI